MKKKIKKVSSILLRISISIILLVFLFRKVDRAALLVVLRNINYPLLICAFLAFAFNYILSLLRWEMILKSLHIRLPLKKVAVPFFGGIFFNLFLPSTIGGDVIKTMHLVRHTQKNKEIIASVFLDRLSGYIGLILVAGIAVLFGYRLVSDPAVLIFIAAFTILLISILVALFNGRIYRRINRFFSARRETRLIEPLIDLHDEIHYFKHKKGVIVANIIFSLFIQLTGNVVFYLTALSLGLKVSFIYFLIFIPIIGAITLLPISIGGLGLRDASMILFFTKVGVAKNAAFAMSLLNFTFLIIIGMIGGLIYVLTLHPRRV